VGHEPILKVTVKARMLAMVHAWRDDWRRTKEGTKVVLIIVAMLFLAWAAFAIWLWIGFRF
jgi:hypothetical protein